MADNITDIVYYMDRSVDRSVDLDDEAAKRHFKKKMAHLSMLYHGQTRLLVLEKV